MSRIKGKNTKPEVLVRKRLHSEGYRFRLHVKELPGKPDIVLPKYKTVVMVHGCFWHGHEICGGYKIPGTRTEWWEEKIGKTRARDKRTDKELSDLGWKVITVYECDLKKEQIEATFEDLVMELKAS